MRELDIDQFNELIEESQDLQVDAMRAAQQPLDEIVALGHDRRSTKEYAEIVREEEESHSRRAALLGLGAIAGGVGLVAASATPAYAEANADIMALQTAASLENLAVLTYKTALTLPYLKDSSRPIKTVAAFATITMKQHMEHGQAFNARAKALGGKVQNGTNPKYTPVVTGMIPALKKGGPLDVVALAITLEDVATSTYVQNIQDVTDPQIRLLFGTIAGVESQHLATLHAVQALLKGGGASLITVKATGGATDAAKLPAAAGSVGFPEGFKKTDLASPATEGAVS
ncbi:MAG: ferritin-like domain-containing protein [Actinomycetota bacterium]|nr:ferritin-like domain-containing protein [Actinomycetota bacterium]